MPSTAEARKASQRVLEDDSLRYGDIVSTDPPAHGVQGMFFVREIAPDDFVPLTTAPLIDSLDSNRKAVRGSANVRQPERVKCCRSLAKLRVPDRSRAVFDNRGADRMPQQSAEDVSRLKSSGE